MPRLKVQTESYPIATPFTIARGSKTEARVVVVELSGELSGELSRDIKIGRGECVPYPRYGESVESVMTAIEGIRSKIEAGATREQLQSLLPAGAARNAIDCAYWDLEAKIRNQPAFKTAGLTGLKSLTTAYTISLGELEVMVEATKKVAHRPILKIKLGAKDGDIERIHAIRKAAPNSVLIADANEGWTEENLEQNLLACKAANFSLIEQPLPAKNDELLRKIKRAVPVCADESVHGLESVDRLVGLYDFINVKLDKTGGLTEALELCKRARAKKLGLMVGCMVGTSLAMAPATLIAQDAEFVDLDGPLLLSRDRENGLRFEGSTLFPPEASLWG